MMGEVKTKDYVRLIKDEQYAKIICDKIDTFEVADESELLDKLIVYCTENNLIEANAWFLREKGWVQYKKSNFIKMKEYTMEAYDIFVSKNNINGILTCITTLLASACSQKKYDEAIEWVIKGVKIAEENNNLDRLVVIKLNAATIYMDLMDFHKARELLEEIEKLSYFESKSNEVVAYLNRALCEIEFNNFNEALNYSNRAYKIANEYALEMRSNVLSIQGDIYKNMKLYNKAEEAYKKSITINNEVGLDIYIIESLLNWSEVDLITGKYEEAIKKLEEVKRVKEKNSSTINEINFNKFMSQAYKGIGNYEKAYEFLAKYIEAEKDLEKDKINKLQTLNDVKEEQMNKTYKVLYEQTEAIYRVGQEITSQLNKKSIFKVIADEINLLVNFDVFQIAVYKPQTNRYDYQLIVEKGNDIKIDCSFVAENSFGDYCIKNKAEILVGDLEKEYFRYIDGTVEDLQNLKMRKNNKDKQLTQSLIFVPMILRDKVIGMISIQSYEKYKYEIKDLAALKILASYTAIALENARLYKEVEYSATYDVLTGIFNRREVLNRYYELYDKRKAGSGVLSIIMIDIDNFKKVNDTYGHQIGDTTLNLVSKTIKASIRDTDIVGRYGGEEFIVIIDNLGIEKAREIAERVRVQVSTLAIPIDGKSNFSVTISLGISTLNNSKKTSNKLIEYADKALYEAKNSGKNKVVISLE